MARLEDVIRQLAATPTVSPMRPGPNLRAKPELNVRAGFPRIAPLLFARAKDDKAGTVAQNDKTSISDVDFAAVIDRVKTAFAKRNGGALTVGIEPVGGMNDLPPALQESARGQQLTLGEGMLFDNVVYGVQQTHSTPKEVEKTIFHANTS
jgi:hypothetical protein